MIFSIETRGRYTHSVLRERRMALFVDFYLSFKTDAVNIAIAQNPGTSLAMIYSKDKYNYANTIRETYRDRSKIGTLEIPGQKTS